MLRLDSAAGSGPASHAAAVLDASVLASQTGGDVALEREVLALFRRQARLLLFRMEATTDPAGRRDVAHRMKGAAAAVGARHVEAAAAALEAAAARGAPLEEAVAVLAERVAEAVRAIDARLS